jgi:hypothetical protein
MFAGVGPLVRGSRESARPIQTHTTKVLDPKRAHARSFRQSELLLRRALEPLVDARDQVLNGAPRELVHLAQLLAGSCEIIGEAERDKCEQLRCRRCFAAVLELFDALVDYRRKLAEVLCVSVGDNLDFGSSDLDGERVFHTHRFIRAERIASSASEHVILVFAHGPAAPRRDRIVVIAAQGFVPF